MPAKRARGVWRFFIPTEQFPLRMTRGVNLGYYQLNQAEVEKRKWRTYQPTHLKYFEEDRVWWYKRTLPADVSDPKKTSETSSVETLLQIWSGPDVDDLPELEASFSDVWESKKPTLEYLARCFSTTDTEPGEWDVYNEGIAFERFPRKTWTPHWKELRIDMKAALGNGMRNGSAKDFIASLCRFLLRDEDGIAPIRMFDHQQGATTSTSDMYKGFVQYMDEVSFETSSHWVPSSQLKSIPSRSSACGTVDGSETSAISVIGKPKGLSPNFVLKLDEYQHLCMVFECTSGTSEPDKKKSVLQNFRQLFSLMHNQDAILGCYMSSQRCIFLLVCKQPGEPGSFQCYRGPDLQFRKNDTFEFCDATFLKICKSILQVMYITERRMRKQLGNADTAN